MTANRIQIQKQCDKCNNTNETTLQNAHTKIPKANECDGYRLIIWENTHHSVKCELTKHNYSFDVIEA